MEAKCELCGRKLQKSRHHPLRCVCCDVHEGQCRHRQPGPGADSLLEIGVRHLQAVRFLADMSKTGKCRCGEDVHHEGWLDCFRKVAKEAE